MMINETSTNHNNNTNNGNYNDNNSSSGNVVRPGEAQAAGLLAAGAGVGLR